MKPGDLALGIRDLFAVLVPGALLLLLIPPTYTSWLLGDPLRVADALRDTILFLTSAYAVGSLIGAAAGLLDPLAERMYRPATSLWPSRRSVAKDEAAQFESLRSTARGLERRILKDTGVPTNDTPLWNDKAFWRNYLRISSAPAVAELDRVEGQQKLFRALGVVFLLVAAVSGLAAGSLAAIVVGLLFFALFVTYRRRFNIRLYQLAIAYYSYSRQQSVSPATDGAKAGGATATGGPPVKGGAAAKGGGRPAEGRRGPAKARA
jgi:hypothetical protein